jgi:DNA polymerase-3 subunit epsilon
LFSLSVGGIMSSSFVAIDFETANAFRGSACQVGLIRVVDGKIEEQFQSFLKPPPGHEHFSPFNIMLHGVTPEDVIDAPEIPDFVQTLKEFSGGLPLVAHNAAFDLGVLRDGLDVYGLNYPSFRYFCTLVLSRRALSLLSYSLPDVAEEFGITFEGHHKADVDALVCAEIALGLVRQKGVKSLEDLAEVLNVIPGKIESSSWNGCHSKALGSERFSAEKLSELRALIGEENYNPESPMMGQSVVFTGTLGSMSRAEAWARIEAVGATPEKGVTKHTNMLVFGVQDPSHLRPGADSSNKYLKAQELRAKGQPIEVIDEASFLRMLYAD